MTIGVQEILPTREKIINKKIGGRKTTEPGGKKHVLYVTLFRRALWQWGMTERKQQRCYQGLLSSPVELTPRQSKVQRLLIVNERLLTVNQKLLTVNHDAILCRTRTECARVQRATNPRQAPTWANDRHFE